MIKTLKLWYSLSLGHLPEQSADGKAFCLEYEEILNDQTIHAAYILTLLLLPPLTFIFYIVWASQYLIPAMLVFHISVFALLVSVFPKRKSRTLRPVIWLVFCSFVIFYAWTGYETLKSSSAGKTLRQTHSDTDRIIFGVDTLLQLKIPFAIQQASLEIKNISESEIFFIEPLNKKGPSKG